MPGKDVSSARRRSVYYFYGRRIIQRSVRVECTVPDERPVTAGRFSRGNDFREIYFTPSGRPADKRFFFSFFLSFFITQPPTGGDRLPVVTYTIIVNHQSL